MRPVGVGERRSRRRSRCGCGRPRSPPGRRGSRPRRRRVCPRAASIAASGQKGMPGQLAGDPLGQDQRVGGELLFGVLAGDVDEVGGVGVDVGVDPAGDHAGVEGRSSRRAGAAADAGCDLGRGGWRGRRERRCGLWPGERPAPRASSRSGVVAGPQAGGVTRKARWPVRKLRSRFGVGELRQAVEGRGQVARAGSGSTRPASLTRIPAARQAWRPGRPRPGSRRGSRRPGWPSPGHRARRGRSRPSRCRRRAAC